MFSVLATKAASCLLLIFIVNVFSLGARRFYLLHVLFVRD